MKLFPRSLCLLPLMCLQLTFIISINFQQLQAKFPGNVTDKIALHHFKESITGDPLGVLKSWNESVPFCNWIGITCSRRHQRVTSLNLHGQKLSGTISQHIGNLSFLRHINLQNNSLRGTIPKEVGKLFRLEKLILRNNTLEGEIPVNLTSCSRLKIIYLSWNNISGNIPAEIGSLVKLQGLYISVNRHTGTLPTSLGNLSSLVEFRAAYNYLVGGIPNDISRLNKLDTFLVTANSLSGTIPPFLFNISSLVFISVAGNKFDGSLPDDAGIDLSKLQELDMGDNQISGTIPISLSNASQLQVLDITNNSFVGPVPSNLGDLRSLWYLNLGLNNLGIGRTDDLVFLSSLQNCRNLSMLDIVGNSLRGSLPESLANFSFQLTELHTGGNQIFGRIPPELGNFSSLFALDMEENLFTGVIPSDFGKLQKLQELSLERNRLSGSIPSSIGNLTHLYGLWLTGNRLEGLLPSSLGNCKSLNYLVAESNNLTGAIPKEILSLPSLIEVGLSDNFLTGSLPVEVGELKALYSLRVSDNVLSGQIPPTIGDCSSLESLFLEGNSFQGTIPESMASLKGITYLDLSRNNLSGEIPKALQNLIYLHYLNISINDLDGEVPMGGVFSNASAVFVGGNGRLCGGISELNLPKCPTRVSKKGRSTALKIIIIIICLFLCGLLLLALLALSWKTKSKEKSSSAAFELGQLKTISYRSLHDATNGFSSENKIGSGSFGTVYKGFLSEGEIPIAVKVLNLQQMGASKSVLSECNALKNIRHRNLVKLITFCSSLDYKGNEFKALVFKLMKNGSLEEWLHPDDDSNSQPRNLNLLQRLSIAIDVASALHYLHELCGVPIVHHDLKPSNVLLDDDMVAHVSDFGLARILSSSCDPSQSKTSTIGILGTIGYTAPEYGIGAAASKEGDVYSYGIMVLEIFSGRRLTDNVFKDGLSLRDFVKAALPERHTQVIDPTLFTRDEEMEAIEQRSVREEEESDDNEIEAAEDRSMSDKKLKGMEPHGLNVLLSVFEIGISCSEESPKERLKMADVVRKLHLVKDAFFDDLCQRSVRQTTVVGHSAQ